VTYGKFGDSPTVTTFRPIFLTQKGRITGTTHGNPGERLIRVEAKPGYAVGALTIKAGLGVDGMSVTFMEIDEDGLNPNRTYESEWLGGMGGDEKKRIAGTGAPVVGIYGATAEGTSTFNGLGVVTAEVKAAQPENLLANGSFEDAPPAINDGHTNINLAKGSGELKGWTIAEPGCGIIDSTYWTPAEGSRSLALSNFGVVSQRFDTKKDQKYRVTFQLAGDPLGPGEVKTLRVRAAGQGAEFKFDSTGKSRPEMDWVQKTWEFTAKSDQTVLEFSGQTEGLWGPALDDVNVAPVSD